ncbi:MAG: ATP-binding protein [Bacteroidia bacterium]|nr:ATP-binding protein [Bacteroidia bacterium]
MKKLSVLFASAGKISLFLLFPLFMSSQKDTVISGFSSPESVISDGKFIYVSNLGLKPQPTVKDTDGYISKLSLKGEIIKLKFIAGLNAPKGMAVSGNKLYVTDIDAVKGFDLKTGKEVFNLSFEKEKLNFLNDLCNKDEKHLFVSATDVSKIFEIDLAAKKYSELIATDSLLNPNGLYYDSKIKALYVATMNKKGRLYSVVLGERKNMRVTIFSEVGLYDGLWMAGKDFFVSDWGFDGKGKIKLFNSFEMKFSTPDLKGKNSFSGPADFYYNEKTKKFWIPEMLTGNLHIISY